MENNSLIKYLNWFYTLEVSQVELYLTQAKKSEDKYIAYTLLKIAETEAKHAKLFNDIIIRMGTKPYRLDSLISHIVGHIPGVITPLTGTVNLFLYNYTLETIAIADYKKLLEKIEVKSELHQDLTDILISNLIDEDFHRIWFKNRHDSLKKMTD